MNLKIKTEKVKYRYGNCEPRLNDQAKLPARGCRTQARLSCTGDQNQKNPEEKTQSGKILITVKVAKWDQFGTETN